MLDMMADCVDPGSRYNYSSSLLNLDKSKLGNVGIQFRPRETATLLKRSRLFARVCSDGRIFKARSRRLLYYVEDRIH